MASYRCIAGDELPNLNFDKLTICKFDYATNAFIPLETIAGPEYKSEVAPLLQTTKSASIDNLMLDGGLCYLLLTRSAPAEHLILEIRFHAGLLLQQDGEEKAGKWYRRHPQDLTCYGNPKLVNYVFALLTRKQPEFLKDIDEQMRKWGGKPIKAQLDQPLKP